MSTNADTSARMNQSMITYWGGYGRSEGRILHQTDDHRMLWTGIPHPVCNIIFIQNHRPDRLHELLQQAKDLIDQHGIGLSWWVSPEAQAEGAKQTLAEAGLEFDGMAPAMACDLAGFEGAAMPEGLQIETVQGPDARAAWADVAAPGFHFDSTQTAAMSAAERDIPESWLKGQYRYLGLLDGKPVAVSSLVMAGGYAGIYAVATLADARRRGIGAAMTAHAMAEGRAQGADQAVLQATEMGKPVYERLGYRTVLEYALYLQG
jgi:ribosomal protein S18 acetylase RimI-like enzyme